MLIGCCYLIAAGRAADVGGGKASSAVQAPLSPLRSQRQAEAEAHAAAVAGHADLAKPGVAPIAPAAAAAPVAPNVVKPDVGGAPVPAAAAAAVAAAPGDSSMESKEKADKDGGAAAAAAGAHSQDNEKENEKLEHHHHHGAAAAKNKAESSESSGEEKSGELAALGTNFGFIHAFLASISVIVVSEIGDKTFFIAAIMSMKHSRYTVYSGAMLALGIMTLLSAMLGNILTKLIPKTYTYYASSFLFALFGLKMLREGWQMSHADASDEYEEASVTLRESEEKSASVNGKADLEAGGSSSSSSSSLSSGAGLLSTSQSFVHFFRKYVSAIFLQAFVLTFLAEWGDRSQISTIILGARENMLGTVLGGVIGHGMCTGLAVIGGRMIAQRISVKTVTLAGAFVFLFFAFSAFVLDPDDF